MKAFLAVSAAGGDPPDRPDERVLGHLAPAGEVAVHATGDGWVVLTAPELDDEVVESESRFTVRLTRALRTAAGDVPSARLAGWLRDPRRPSGDLATVLPPFAAAHRAGPGAPVVLSGDWLGVRQLFWWQGDGLAAVSTSALALAALAGQGLDRTALGVQSLLGWQVGLGTVFQGVVKLAPGCCAVLERGRVSLRRYADALRPDPAARPSAAAAVDTMAEVLREIHRGCITDHPATVLQLSAGQDTRMLLCAIPPQLRRGLSAFTLDVRGGVESRIAARLARAGGLAHRVYWLDEQPPVDAATVYGMATTSAAALDCMASPLALAPLMMIEETLDQGYRLAGTGGETARGFYYPGQPGAAATSSALIRRLARWRLFTNEAVADAAVEPDFASAARREAMDRIEACFGDYDADWLRATDEFYLYQRVQRWAGAHTTVAAVERFSVNPLLDRQFMSLALAPPPRDKRSSRLTTRLMRELDAGLAGIPLDSGLVPARIAAGGLAAHGSVARATARKVSRRIRRRLGRGHQPVQLGAAEVAGLVVAHWRAEPGLLKPVRAHGVIRDDWLDDLLAGRASAPPATVAFLVNLAVAAETAGAAPATRATG